MKKLFPYLTHLKDVRFQLFIAIITGALYGISTGAGIPALIHFICPLVFGEETLEPSLIILYISLPVIVTLVRASSNFLNTYYVGFCGQYLLEKIRLQVFEKIQRLPISFFNRFTPAELITRTMNDTGILQQSLIELAQDIIKQPITLLGTIGIIIYSCMQHTDIVFLILFLSAIPLCIVPIRIVGVKLKKRAFLTQVEAGKLTHRINQNLSAIKEVRAFCMEDSEKARFAQASRDYFGRFMKLVKYNVILSPIIEVIAAVGISFSFFYAYKKGIDAEIFFSIVAALYLSYEPLKKIGRLSNEMQKGAASLERLEALLNEPITICDPENPVKVDRLKGNIIFDKACFAYEKTAVIDNLSTQIEAGKTYALVGSSGAGKTTFANLIPRFYDLDSGTLTIDGIDIKNMRLRDLRRNIAIVSQDPTLFNDTIENNILIGYPNATHEMVMDAAKKAYAHDFIQELPNGYKTEVGEDGSQLSGGQKQRVALARAFLKDAPILILDEATSALDTVSEKYIQLALEKLFSGKTVIIIAHRFSSIKHADQILVFDKGEIVETGTHEKLFAQEGKYHKLYQQQIS